jgi:hypothetical protein
MDWQGRAGFLNSSGCRSTPPTPLDLKRDAENGSTLYVGALYGNNGEFTNAQRYEARYQLDYKINDKLSWPALRGRRTISAGCLPGYGVHGRGVQVHRYPTTKLAFRMALVTGVCRWRS